MILVDINLLLPAFRPSLPDHEPARRWLRESVEGGDRVVLTDVAVSGFLRIATNRRAFEDPSTTEIAVGFIDDLLGSGAGLMSAGDRHWRLKRELSLASHATGDLVSDAHLAAIALEHGARIATRDRDFARFPGVDWFDPLDS